MSAPRQRLLLWGLKLLLTAGILWSLFRSGAVEWDGLLRELRGIQGSQLMPWLLAAVVGKLLGILGNVLRWQILLRAQGLALPFPFLFGSFLIGRFFGIATPGTLGLDGFRLYDSIQKTAAPWRCAAVIAADKVAGLAGLLLTASLVLPLGRSLVPADSALGWAPLAVGTGLASVLALALLLHPSGLDALLARVPAGRFRAPLDRIRDAATAYSGKRSVLLSAVALAAWGHLTTAWMYFALLRGILAPEGVALLMPEGGLEYFPPDPSTVVLAGLVMTVATLVVPTAGGEGVREWVFVALLAPQIPAATAFLFGHLGFWVEKAVLGLPGGLIYWLRGRPRHPG